jgi:uncharacterized protein (TIGR02466 family)
MPIRAWFPTFIYCEPLLTRGAERFNAELLRECHQIRDFDRAGQKWSATNYPGGYTSYGSMTKLHKMSSTFAELERRITRHARRYARHLEFDLRGHRLEMTDCWINIMPERTTHGLHLHPLSLISGTYYVATPPGSSGLKFEDPRLACFMAAPPRTAKCRDESKQFVTYDAKAGNVILFESWLRHEVPPTRSEEERVSISFNYNWF